MPRTPPRNRPIPHPKPNTVQVPNPMIPGELMWTQGTSSGDFSPPVIATPEPSVPASEATKDGWRYILNVGKSPTGELKKDALLAYLAGLSEVDWIHWEQCQDWRSQRAFLLMVAKLARANHPDRVATFKTKTGAVYAEHWGVADLAPPVPCGAIVVYANHIMVTMAGCTDYRQIDWMLAHNAVSNTTSAFAQVNDNVTGTLGKWFQFCHAAAITWKARIDAVKAMYPNKKVVLIGHSLGAAAMTLIMAADLKISVPDLRVLPGDIAFGFGIGMPNVYAGGGPVPYYSAPNLEVYNNPSDPIGRIPSPPLPNLPDWYRLGVGTIPGMSHFATIRDSLTHPSGFRNGPPDPFPESLARFLSKVDIYHGLTSYLEALSILLPPLVSENEKWGAFRDGMAGLPLIPFTAKPGGW